MMTPIPAGQAVPPGVAPEPDTSQTDTFHRADDHRGIPPDPRVARPSRPPRVRPLRARVRASPDRVR
jgi:hypothetical protein